VNPRQRPGIAIRGSAIPRYRPGTAVSGTTRRFELDSADAAKSFMTTSGFSEAEADVVWTAIALDTTPEVPYRLDPVIAATTLGVVTDVLGMRLDCRTRDDIEAVTAVHPGRTSKTRSCRPLPKVSKTG
jgi:hypothetical protein